MNSSVTFVVPVYNAGSLLISVIEAIAREARSLPAFEILVIDDASGDDGIEMLRAHPVAEQVTFLDGDGQGAAHALNVGLEHARYPLWAQIDQDVVIQPGWLRAMARRLEETGGVAVQGLYDASPTASMLERVTILDHQLRSLRNAKTYSAISTGNTLFRTDALRAIGGFDAELGYGYDTDASYRLRTAGGHLVICQEARAVHTLAPGWMAYLERQYGLGYGRIDVVTRHPKRSTGDSYSPLSMMLHALLTPVASASALLAGALYVAHGPWPLALWTAGAITLTLFLERLAAGFIGWWRLRSAVGFLFPWVHAVRNLAWLAAMVAWVWHRAMGERRSAGRSMFRDPSR